MTDARDRAEPGAETGAETGAEPGPGGDRSAAPVLRIVTPDATPEEVAALVAVFSALQAPPAQAAEPRSQWAAPARRMTRALPHGPGGWRASGLPR
ncbi:MAG TPA: acyl-CoA carboxylase subunit epsilon [Marmoricola sp.]|nr:acyl-CoA carboxylase subunit epsilon [Marmoricola sp.]